MDRDRFYKLVESKLGNVKPLLGEQTSEQTGTPETKSNVKNIFSNFINRLKINPKIKEWTKKIFGKENPQEKEVLDYIKGPKEPQQNLTPTTPPAEAQSDTQQTIAEVDTPKDYYGILSKNKNILLGQVNIAIGKFIVPRINNYLNSNINKWYGDCYSVWPFGETCFGANLTVKFNNLNLADVTLTKGSGKVIVNYKGYASIYVGLYVDNFVLGRQTNFYPSISGTIEIIGNTKIVIPPPNVRLWTDWVDVGVVYVYINDNFLKMHNRYVGPYEWALPIQSSINSGFKGKTIDIAKEMPVLYKLMP